MRKRFSFRRIFNTWGDFQGGGGGGLTFLDVDIDTQASERGGGGAGLGLAPPNTPLFWQTLVDIILAQKLFCCFIPLI